MHRRAYLEIALALVVAVALTGCGAQTVGPPAAETVEVVRISGSSAAMPLVRLLTDTSDTPDVEWRYTPSPGSQNGIEGVAAGELDIGVVSRLPTPEEEALGLRYTALSRDGLVVAVHPGTGVTELSTQQVCDIFGGTHVNWSELGGADLPIVVLDRADSEPARAIMREHVFGEEFVASPSSARLYTDDDVITGVEHTVGAVGYFSLGYGISQDVRASYPALDGVIPCVRTIRDGTYRIVRPIGVVTAAEPPPAVAAFLEWATSQTAADLMESNGYAAVR